MKEKKVKEVKMHKFLVCAYKYQDLAQSQENFARSYDRETVTFRNSGLHCITLHYTALHNTKLVFQTMLKQALVSTIFL